MPRIKPGLLGEKQKPLCHVAPPPPPSPPPTHWAEIAKIAHKWKKIKSTKIFILPYILNVRTFPSMLEKFGTLFCRHFCKLFSFSTVGET